MPLEPLASSSQKKSLFSIFLDAVFPILCLACQKRGAWICADCQKKIPLRIEQECPLCKKESHTLGATCFECKGSTALDGIFSATYYQIPIVARAIHTFKYRFVPGVSVPLSEILIDALTKSNLPLPDVILPVPLHKRRLRFRGFNQASLLAKNISENITPEIPIPFYENTLKRIRYTKPQIKTLSRTERLANLSNAFILDPALTPDIKGKSIWLIDDVATTSATLEECAKVLKKSGAKSVYGIVIAR
ncbi:MAG: ComF family protein [Patescibacteria group bacterium]